MILQNSVFTTPWGLDVDVSYRPDTNDWNTAYSCIVQDEYAVHELPQGNYSEWCIDIGGHIGGCSLALLSRGYNVIIVEPLPENIEIIKNNLRINGWTDNAIIFENAIGSKDNDEVEIAYGDTANESGRHHQFVGVTLLNENSRQKNINYHKVKTISINTIFKNIEKTRFLKIDCEGAEWGAFESVSSKVLDNIQNISAELHPTDKYNGDLWNSFHSLIGENYTDITKKYYGDTFNGCEIGLAFFLNNEYPS